jgi:fumarate reductase iron-sulfur subunit
MASEETVKLEVFRWHPEKKKEPSFQTYEVPFRKDWVVLDALNYIKDKLDGTLTYRWSCRMGVCGSCGMMVNGVPKLTCAAFLRDYHPGTIRVEPLVNFPVERDLVINLEDFLKKLQSVVPWIHRRDEPPLEKGEFLQTPAQLAKFKQYSMCINCMLCYAACPVYGHEEDFIGPAALSLARRYNLDSRDDASEARKDVVYSEHGVWDCTFVGECSTVCPKNVDPAGAIQQSKVEATNAWFVSVLYPWGKGG